MGSAVMDEKTTMEAVEHVDHKREPSILDPEKPVVVREGADRFGAYAKTDPLEIALVRKIDLIMMVSRAVFIQQSESFPSMREI